MKNNIFPVATAGLLAAGFAMSSCGNITDKRQKPNILIIVVDDLGYSDMSFLPYASDDVHTPNINRIAERGIFFTNAYATSPICSPSRVGLITGKYQSRWGNYWYGEGGLPAHENTLPQFLHDAGYYNIKIGKTHLNGGPVEHPFDHGFDEFLGFIDHTWDYLRLSQNDVDHYGEVNARRAHIGPLLDGREKVSFENDYTTDIFSRKTVEAIQRKGDRPFYVQLEYNAVHQPTYVCHPDYLEKYGIDQFPFWDPEVEPYLSWHRKWGHLGEVDPDGRKRYLLQLEVLDAGIGTILDALEASGELENTIIFFMSDNGGELSTYSQNDPLNGYKYMFGEGGIRVPMIVAYPKLIKEQKYVTPKVSLMDVVPTILETIGLDLPGDLDGRSLWPAIEDDKEIHDYLVWSNGRETLVVRKGAWKLARNIGNVHNTYELVKGIAYEADSHYLFPGGTRLIDLDQDIGETTNLAEQFPEVVSELEQIYLTWRSEMSDPRTRDGELKVQPHPGNYIGNSLKELGAEVWADGSVVDNYPGKVIDGYDATFWKYTGGTAQSLYRTTLLLI